MKMDEDIPKKSRKLAEKSIPNSTPQITVITVVYNGILTIEQTIKNICSLSYKNLRYIVVDGGSTDGTVDVLKKNKSCIDTWISEKDLGIYDAMNKGWALAENDSYVIFLGSGDKIIQLPDVSEFTGNNVLYGDVYIGDYLFGSITGNRLKLGNTLHHQALLIPKKLNPDPPFDLKYKVYADYDFNARLISHGASFTKADGFTGYALPEGLSSNMDIIEMAKVSGKNFGPVWGVLSLLYLFYTKYLYKYKIKIINYFKHYGKFLK